MRTFFAFLLDVRITMQDVEARGGFPAHPPPARELVTTARDAAHSPCAMHRQVTPTVEADHPRVTSISSRTTVTPLS